MGDPSGWCLIESDPAVFTELCANVGVKGIQFEEIYSIEQELFHQLVSSFDRVYGLIFLFKWETPTGTENPIDPNPHPDLFFAHQVITNACATQAALCVLMNHPEVDIGPELEGIRSFSRNFDYNMRGLSLSNCAALRNAHNSFRPESSFEIVDSADSVDNASFHYVSFVPFHGKLYELDGLKQGPVCIGTTTEDTWLESARSEIQRRIDQYQNVNTNEQQEIRFNLMAVVKDKINSLTQRIDQNRFIRQRAIIKLVSFGEDAALDDEVDDELAPEDTPTIEDLPDTPDELRQTEERSAAEIRSLNDALSSEKRKRQRWTAENARRRHDFVPFALCALRHLAKGQELRHAYEEAVMSLNTVAVNGSPE